MVVAATGLMVIAAVLVSLPVMLFVFEIGAAIFLPKRSPRSPEEAFLPARIAVLVPAHNEGVGLRATLEDIAGQLRPGCRMVVIADNCSDDTAAIARGLGAEVVERHDPTNRGKAYALDYGLQHLRGDPPEIVVIVDADCRLEPETIECLATACMTTGRPAQALDLMTAPERSAINHQVAEFAWRIKNWVRPMGLAALGLPCQLMGTGMAFPWELIASSDLGGAHLAEDLQLGLGLAAMGSPPIFCPSAVVTSQFPTSVEGGDTQRRRWEYGHIQTIISAAPRYFVLALRRRRLGLLALTLDLIVPPLSLLALLIVAMTLVTGAAAAFGLAPAAFVVSLANLVASILAAILCWLYCGRELLPLRSLPLVAAYVGAKLRLYLAFLFGRGVTSWVRTDRGPPATTRD